MADSGVDALVLLVNGNVSYATGATWPLSDAGRANIERPVAVVVAGDDDAAPVRAVAAADGQRAPRSTPTTCTIRCTSTSTRGSRSSSKVLADLVPAQATPRGRRPDRRRCTAAAGSSFASGRRGRRVTSSAPPGSIKTPDELATIRHALWITEQAMAEVQSQLAPGKRQTDLTALFLRRVFELGAEANILDPIWQVMPRRRSELPWTVHGDIACPLLTTERELAAGDVLWVDTGILYGGYHSDFGRTWIVGQEPSARQQEQYHRWREISDAATNVMRAGRHRRRPDGGRDGGLRRRTGRGCRTSTSATGSGSTPPRCPSSAPTSAMTSMPSSSSPKA